MEHLHSTVLEILPSPTPVVGRKMNPHLIERAEEVDGWCAQHGYTRTSLAFELGITRQTLFNWTRADVRLPRVLTLSLLGLEQLPPEQRSQKGKRVRKKSKRQLDRS